MLINQNWGLIDYKLAWEQQKELVARLLDGGADDYLIFCEHNSVITLGRNSSRDNIILGESALKALNVDLYEIDRGGDVTLHNAGQLVGYPILSLFRYKLDLHWYLRMIEQTIIDVLAEYGIKAGRVEGYTGVWIDGERKICAIGVHCSRWITSHGFAFNVNNDLNEFNYIVPCGINEKNKSITSLSTELGANIDMVLLRAQVDFQFRKNLANF